MLKNKRKHWRGWLIGLALVVSHVIAVVAAAPLIIDWYLRSETTFVPMPEIDTVFAPDFTKANYAAVQNGMSTTQVESLLGAPFRKQSIKVTSTAESQTFMAQDNAECWYYSRDGALVQADFSWFSYQVCFENNLVYLKQVREHGD